MGRTRDRIQALHEEARRHVAAIRAFHSGLLAESYKHTHLLQGLSRFVDLVREDRQHVRHRLTAVNACLKELAKLRKLRKPWRDTYEDLQRSLLRTRALMTRVLSSSRKV